MSTHKIHSSLQPAFDWHARQFPEDQHSVEDALNKLNDRMIQVDETAQTIRDTKELTNAGYIKTPCKSCEGKLVFGFHHCLACGGKGYRWEPPIIG